MLKEVVEEILEVLGQELEKGKNENKQQPKNLLEKIELFEQKKEKANNKDIKTTKKQRVRDNQVELDINDRSFFKTLLFIISLLVIVAICFLLMSY